MFVSLSGLSSAMLIVLANWEFTFIVESKTKTKIKNGVSR